MSKDHTREKELKKYLQQIRILIPIRSPGVKKFLRDFRSSLEEYTEEHPDWTMEDITQRFGSPSISSTIIFPPSIRKTYADAL